MMESQCVSSRFNYFPLKWNPVWMYLLILLSFGRNSATVATDATDGIKAHSTSTMMTSKDAEISKESGFVGSPAYNTDTNMSLVKMDGDMANTRALESSPFRCSCRSCESGGWDAMANGQSCGKRIEYMMSAEAHLYPTERDACERLGNMEYPDECSACNPLSCDRRTPPAEPSFYCGCRSCTPDIYKSKTTDPESPVSCGARMTWLMLHQNLEEGTACSIVSQQYPTICGPACDPQLCHLQNEQHEQQNRKTDLQQPIPAPPTQPVQTSTIFVPQPRQQQRPKPNFRLNPPHPTSGIAVPIEVGSFDIRKDLGPNAVIIDSTFSTAAIQGLFDDFYNRQINDEMGRNRYTLMFLPGVYGSPDQPLMLKIGYYTEVLGLGGNPNDVVVYGKIEVYNRCFAADPYNAGKFIPAPANDPNGSLCFALNNFWRGLANLSINIVTLNQDQCRSRAMFWAISQASSMRRVDIKGGELSLMDYCTEPGFSSGGYIGDSRVAGKIFNGSQQQFIARNLDIGEWDGGIWNQVFLGVNGAPSDSVWPNPPYTTFSNTPISREKPYLYVDSGNANAVYVRVPNAVRKTSGITWSNGQLTPGVSIPISRFFIVNPSHSAATINAVLALGRNLIFTPGVYEIDQTIKVKKEHTIILGLGLATLTAVNGVVIMQLANKPGIVLAGIMFDAGAVQSDVLLRVGPRGTSGSSRRRHPITLSDIYFRVGGPHVGKADVCLEVNSNNVLIDHTWIWRADHGIEGFDPADGFEGDNERWVTNTGRVGMIVNGKDVTATGLFVEHYQQHNVEWNGEGGSVYFFQNELPYDPPSQSDWMTLDGTQGWAGYKVSDNVQTHELHGGGVYVYNRNDPSIITKSGFIVPKGSLPGILMHNIFTRNLSGPGIVLNVINDVGDRVDSNQKGPSYVQKYP